MFNLSDDDSFSTQLEGKKLKNRGAKIKGNKKKASAELGSHLLEIDEQAPALMEDLGVEEGQEYFTDRELSKENKKDREERLKKELNAARLQQMELQKQQQQEQKLQLGIGDPNKKLDTIEQGILQSQNKGHKTIETEAKQHQHAPGQDEGAGHHHKAAHAHAAEATGTAVVGALMGEGNIKNMNNEMKPGGQDDNSIPAKMLPDVRGGNKEAGMGM